MGTNTTLSYILAAVDLDHDVYVYKIDEKGELKKNAIAIFLNKNNAQKLIDKYREENEKISNFASDFKKDATSAALKGLEVVYPALPVKFFVGDFIKNFEKREFSFDEIDFVIQRLEPMKSPFPPFGEIDINNFLRNFSTKIFTKNTNYNLPINCFGDKELPLILKDKNASVPTKTSFLDDIEIVDKIRNIAQKKADSCGIFNFFKKFLWSVCARCNVLSNTKIILKPDSSAQGYGVFALEFRTVQGLNLQQILQEKMANLTTLQTVKINDKINDEELKKILKILFFVQYFKIKKIISDKIIADFTNDEINTGAAFLYGQKILIQPFIEGVKIGDIRIILAKMRDGNFAIMGAVFRKSVVKNKENFLTGIMSGDSIPLLIEDFLTADEQRDLIKKTNYVVNQLNTKFRKKYENCHELGLDFLLFGDKKRVFLGEANHYCQGLIPFYEAIAHNHESAFYNKIKGVKIDGEGGIGIAKRIIKNIQN